MSLEEEDNIDKLMLLSDEEEVQEKEENSVDALLLSSEEEDNIDDLLLSSDKEEDKKEDEDMDINNGEGNLQKMLWGAYKLRSSEYSTGFCGS